MSGIVLSACEFWTSPIAIHANILGLDFGMYGARFDIWEEKGVANSSSFFKIYRYPSDFAGPIHNLIGANSQLFQDQQNLPKHWIEPQVEEGLPHLTLLLLLHFQNNTCS